MSREELSQQNFFSSIVSIICALLLVVFSLVLAVPCIVFVGLGGLLWWLWVSLVMRIRMSRKPELSVKCAEQLKAVEEEARAAVQQAAASVTSDLMLYAASHSVLCRCMVLNGKTQALSGRAACILHQRWACFD